ncbi:hypothetical protein SY2F82_72560 [Streptomyces sp. Y2F8-2]|nr:hypothetical protein SY2F82_72560 [Streptomyces sp. Y2F8-2]
MDGIDRVQVGQIVRRLVDHGTPVAGENVSGAEGGRGSGGHTVGLRSLGRGSDNRGLSPVQVPDKIRRESPVRKE